MDPDLLSQFPVAEAAMEALGVVLWSMLEWEADDAIAAAAELYAADPRVERILICTPDKDMAQCVVGERIVLWDRRRETIYDEAGRHREVGRAAERRRGPPGARGRRRGRLPGPARAGATSPRRRSWRGTAPSRRSRPRPRRGTSPGCAAHRRWPRPSATAWTRPCCTATSPACEPADGVPIPQATSTSSGGVARTARAGTRSATSGAWTGYANRPHRWLGED